MRNAAAGESVVLANMVGHEFVLYTDSIWSARAAFCQPRLPGDDVPGLGRCSLGWA